MHERACHTSAIHERTCHTCHSNAQPAASVLLLGTSRVPLNGFAELFGSSGLQRFCIARRCDMPRGSCCKLRRRHCPSLALFYSLYLSFLFLLSAVENDTSCLVRIPASTGSICLLMAPTRRCVGVMLWRRLPSSFPMSSSFFLPDVLLVSLYCLLPQSNRCASDFGWQSSLLQGMRELINWEIAPVLRLSFGFLVSRRGQKLELDPFAFIISTKSLHGIKKLAQTIAGSRTG